MQTTALTFTRKRGSNRKGLKVKLKSKSFSWQDYSSCWLYIALFNLRLPLFPGSIVMRHIALCYLQCRCKRTPGFSEFKLISEFPQRRNYQRYNRVASSSLWILWGFWERGGWVHGIQCLGGEDMLSGCGQKARNSIQLHILCLTLFIPISNNVQRLWIRAWISFTTKGEKLHSA